MEEFLKKIRNHLENLDNRKFMTNIFIVLIMAVGILLVLNIYTSKDKNPSPGVIKDNSNEYTSLEKASYENYIENRLAEILSKLKGVGQVSVMVTLEDGVEHIPATNITTTRENTKELDSQGGTREIVREDETLQVVNTSDEVVVLKEVKPNIRGVIVVAEGAEDIRVLEALYEAVKTVLGVSGNRVQIFPSK